MKTYPHPEITRKIEEIKDMGYERIAQEIEKQITLTINKGGALFHIAKRVDEEHQKCKDLNLLLNTIL